MFQILPTGQKLTREIINNIPRFVLSMIRPGPGIRCFPTGDGGICIATDMVTAGQGRQATGGGGGGNWEIGKVASLDAGGDLINVYLWDYGAGAWEVATTQIYKPHILRYSYWNGATITYTPTGDTRTYNATALDKRYQRRATWDGGGETEVQYITEPYAVNEWLFIAKTQDGDRFDTNQAGRAWAAEVT